MVENKQDKLARAWATLSSLRDRIEQITSGVEEKYAREFHTEIGRDWVKCF